MPFRRRLLAGLTASAFARGVGILSQLVLVPVLLHAWGAKGYGEWLSLTALASYIGYSSIGLTPAVRADMGMAHGRGDHGSMRETYSTALLSILGLSLVGLACIALFLSFVDIYSGLHISTVTRDATMTLIAIMCAQITLNIINGVVSSALGATGRYGLAGILDSTRQLFEFLAVVTLVLVFKTGFIATALVFPLMALVSLVATQVALWRVAPWLSFSPRLFTLRIYKRLWSPMIGGFLLSFGYMGLVIQAPRLILAAAAGPAAVALYSVTTTLLRLARMGGELIAMPTAMEFSFAYGRGDMPLARRLLAKSTSIGVWMMVFAAPPILLFGPAFVHYWTNGRLEAPVTTIAAAMLGAIAYALGISSMQALQAVNRILAPTIALVIVSAPCLLLGYYWSAAAGASGMLASVALLELTLSLAVIFVASRLMQMSMGSILLSLRVPPVAFILRELRLLIAKAGQALGRS